MAEWAKTGSHESLAALVQGWCARVQACAPVSLQHGMSMKATILSLKFPDAESKQMLEVVEKKVLTSCTAAEAPKDVKGQLLTKPYNYLTAAEWGVLEGGNAPARLEILLKRYLKLGMLNLKENTVKAGMALLLAMASKNARAMPSYSEIYDQVQVFKRSFEQLKEAQLDEAHKKHAPGLLRYPDDPEELTREVYKAAYPEDRPLSKDVGADIWLAHIPMRSTSKLLKSSKAPSPASAPTTTEPEKFELFVTKTLDRVFSSNGPLGAWLQNHTSSDTGRTQLELPTAANMLRTAKSRQLKHPT